jgi:hypothetical protein
MIKVIRATNLTADFTENYFKNNVLTNNYSKSTFLDFATAAVVDS